MDESTISLAKLTLVYFIKLSWDTFIVTFLGELCWKSVLPLPLCLSSVVPVPMLRWFDFLLFGDSWY